VRAYRRSRIPRLVAVTPPRDLREWIALLEREGELVRVTAEVDPDLEITEIVDRTVKAGGPALLFENPKGAKHPLLINQFGTERRMCLAFGVESLDELGERVGSILEMQPPTGLMDKVRGLQKLKSIADSRARVVRSGPVQEIVLKGDDVDLGLLPVQRCWPGDPAPFITLPAVITKDPRSGGRNVGMYRMQVIDRNTTFMHWQIHKDGRADWLATDGRIPVAVALGLDPITAYSASAPLPKHIDELMLAGFFRGEPVDLVKGVTVDLEVPANAEIVLEGYIEHDEVGTEGPFGDHTGYYTPPESFPVFHLTAMTMRRDAIYPSIVVGKPPQEDAWLGKATERIFLPAIRATVPEIVDYDLPVAGAFHNCCIVSIQKAFPGHAQKVMHAIWGLGMLSLTKCVVVVDAHVNVHDYEEVMFYAGANVDPARDVTIGEGPLDHLDHAPQRQFVGGKLGIDATAKLPVEGARPWPEEIEMSPEIRSLVARRWSEYGIELVPSAADGGFDKTSRSLRQLLRR
jgi:4-hydroxy-3-polyprenylbenzoate decarboxylase